jgi:hypothetical protein
VEAKAKDVSNVRGGASGPPEIIVSW